MELPKFKCQNDKCGYEWTPRVSKPKVCPHCKRSFKHDKILIPRGDGGVPMEVTLIK